MQTELNPQAFPFYPRQHSRITLLSLNCRSIVNKVSELVAICRIHSPDIVCLSETWLTPNTPFALPGYSIHRRDRTSTTDPHSAVQRGYGGVAILVRDNVFGFVKVRSDLLQLGLEAIWLELRMQTSPHHPIVVCSSYRPPSTVIAHIQDFCSKMEDCLQRIDLSTSTLLLAGDFNAHHSKWHSFDKTSPAGRQLQTLFSCFGLEQMVSFPTHTSPSGRSSCLDLVVTNSPNNVISLDSAAPLGASDHVQIICSLQVICDKGSSVSSRQSSPKEHDSRHRYNFKSVPQSIWTKINEALLNIDWRVHLSSNSVDVALQTFMDTIDSAFGVFLGPWRVPVRSPGGAGTRHKHDYPPWVGVDLRQAIRLKFNLYSKSVKYPSPDNVAAYKAQRNLVKSLSRSSHRAYIRAIKSSLSHPSQCPTLHQFVRGQRQAGEKRTIPARLVNAGSVASSDFEKSEMLNNYFTSIAVPDDPKQTIPPLALSNKIGSEFNSVHVTTSIVRRGIARLKSGKSPGADGISNEVIKSLAPSIAYPLCVIFNLSYSTGRFPATWKIGKVIPIYKQKGSREECGNYRPISLLSCLSKLCERLFYDQLYRHISPALTKAQSGFCRGDSTSMQLCRLIQEIHSERHLHRTVALCYFDLAKAFDTVWHRALVSKLEFVFCIRGAALNWLRSYLADRRQAVVLNGSASGPLPVLSGVPQGSILGPLLFLIYINDLPQSASGVSLFADDTALVRSNTDSNILQEDLQSGINDVFNWMIRWRLKPNIAKTEIMFIPPLSTNRVFLFPSSSTPITIVSHHRHLGLHIDSHLSWSHQVEHIKKRTSMALGCLVSHCSHLTHSCKVLFYKCYILPIFIYANSAWSGIGKNLADALELHHKRILKILFKKQPSFPSSQLYHLAQTCPLSERRTMDSCILAHRLLNNNVPAHLETYNWANNKHSTRTRVLLPLAKTVAFTKSPIFLAYTNWLDLPLDLKLCDNLQDFKFMLSTLCP